MLTSRRPAGSTLTHIVAHSQLSAWQRSLRTHHITLSLVSHAMAASNKRSYLSLSESISIQRARASTPLLGPPAISLVAGAGEEYGTVAHTLVTPQQQSVPSPTHPANVSGVADNSLVSRRLLIGREAADETGDDDRDRTTEGVQVQSVDDDDTVLIVLHPKGRAKAVPIFWGHLIGTKKLGVRVIEDLRHTIRTELLKCILCATVEAKRSVSHRHQITPPIATRKVLDVMAELFPKLDSLPGSRMLRHTGGE